MPQYEKSLRASSKSSLLVSVVKDKDISMKMINKLCGML